MSITLKTEDQLYADALGCQRVQFPSADLTDKGFLGLDARAHAQIASLNQDQIREADNDGTPCWRQEADGTLVPKNSSASLDQWAFVFGLASDVAGVYGRRGATVSSGGAALPTTTAGTPTIPLGALATDPTGTITIKTTAAVTCDGPPNTQTVSLVSVTKGSGANIPAGTTMTWSSPPVGVVSTFVLTAGLSGGQDRETDAQLLTRILLRLQNPPRGGTAADYRFWAEGATDLTTGATLSIYRAFVFPLRGGTGTVDVMALMNSTGISRKPTAAVITKLLAYLNSKRPVTATVRVIEAYMPAALALRIQVRVQTTNRFPWDWDALGVSTSITAVNAGAKTITCTIPANLAAAVDAYVAGTASAPRIQMIISTAGASPKPYQARVTARAGGGVLTIDPYPAVDPTPLTDYFYEGSGVVDTVATNLLAAVDALGPSRESGYADPDDSWAYRVSLSQIAQVVMDSRDTDGSAMVDSIPNLATVGIRIAVGAGAFGPADYTPRDVTGNCAVAYLRSGGIEVIRAV